MPDVATLPIQMVEPGSETIDESRLSFAELQTTQRRIEDSRSRNGAALAGATQADFDLPTPPRHLLVPTTRVRASSEETPLPKPDGSPSKTIRALRFSQPSHTRVRPMTRYSVRFGQRDRKTLQRRLRASARRSAPAQPRPDGRRRQSRLIGESALRTPSPDRITYSSLPLTWNNVRFASPGGAGGGSALK